jgi:hypothetical protein
VLGLVLTRQRRHGANGSTSHDGWHLEVTPAPGVRACGDIEAIDNPAAEFLAGECGLDVLDFIRFWTRLEALAKLTDQPAHLLFHRLRGSPDTRALLAAHPGIQLHTATLPDLVVSVAWTHP